ncbi:MAG: hypothetical protein ACI8PT_000744 [Gammaproteobacteria bacterium]|jgi:hypothetical protein
MYLAFASDYDDLKCKYQPLRKIKCSLVFSHSFWCSSHSQ